MKENKNSEIDLNKSAIMSKFEDLIGSSRIKSAQIERIEKINAKLNEQIEAQKAYIKRLEKNIINLRNELKIEKEQNVQKIEKEGFFEHFGVVMENIQKKESLASESWKEILDALIAEVEDCIRLIENKQGKT